MAAIQKINEVIPHPLLQTLIIGEMTQLNTLKGFAQVALAATKNTPEQISLSK